MPVAQGLGTGLKLVDLRQVELTQLEPLLEEETAEWEEELHWDFSQTAQQVRRYIGPRALPGVALLDGRSVAGYGYTVLEEPKGLIGDVYLRRAWRGTETEMSLFKVLLDALTGTSGVVRVESQMMLVAPEQVRNLARERFVRVFERRLLWRDLSPSPAPARSSESFTTGELWHRFRLVEWEPEGWNCLPELITRAYAGHVDGLINDQFLTMEGAVAFLRSLTDAGGCGEFFRPGSFFASDRETGRLAGAILTSFVARDTTHITQICVAPEARGTGLGRELLARALRAMGEGGARQVTLTVTAANEKANRFYAAAGFAEMRRFCAVVWDAHGHMSHS